MHIQIRYLLAFYLLTVHLLAIQAQTIPFDAQPGVHVEAEVTPNLANEVWMYYQNTRPDSLTLLWRRIEVNKPADWDIDLCDYGACVGGVPASGVMLPIGQYDSAYLKLIVQPKDVQGEAILRFRVADNSQQSLYRDIRFTVRTPGFVHTVGPSVANAFSFFPNPVVNDLYVQLPGKSGTLELLDGQGRVVSTQSIAPDQDQIVLDMRLRQMGLYYLRFTSVAGTMVMAVVKEG